jgi:uncharacterized YigZ family protein
VTDVYRTVAARGETTLARRGSEFFGYAVPARSVDAAEDFVERLRDEYPDATHVVPAYRVRVGEGPEGTMLRAYSSDDGEPSGSAGAPALNVLQGEELENVAVAVVRYYGGTNLGVGGLVAAYSDAVRGAVADAGTTTERPREPFSAVVDYDDSGTVRGILESTGVDFTADYDERVTFAVEPPAAEADALRDRLRSATSGRVTFES